MRITPNRRTNNSVGEPRDDLTVTLPNRNTETTFEHANEIDTAPCYIASEQVLGFFDSLTLLHASRTVGAFANNHSVAARLAALGRVSTLYQQEFAYH